MRPLLIALFLVLIAAPAAARADDDIGYALVVGSNAPGPGQAELAWAEDDAAEVAEVLRDLGGYPRANVRVLIRPTPAALLAAITALERDVAAEAAAGRRVKLFFYYSGHARASGLSLGRDELALAELRSRLLAVPATLTVVVLDACQSGAFSRTKGAEPAADFSFNSRARLDASGVAVLASSTGSELSQESDFLRSSYFTHHLLVGLRGAADDNRDGRVSLDEAYRYTYHQTLVATAATAVGSQHVSVEVDLKGQGEIPLSFPDKATTTITVPADVAGQVLIERLPARAVVAEVHKARGAALAIAVAPGTYQVLVRDDATLWRCSAAPGRRPVTVDLGACTREGLVVTTRKGGGGPVWQASLVLGVGGGRADGYVQRLEDFGYHRQGLGNLQLGAELVKRVNRHVLVGGEVGVLGGDEWRRATELEPLVIRWNTYTLGAVGRVETGGRLRAYGQLGAGLALGRTTFRDSMNVTSGELHPGVYGAAAVGLDWWFARRWGLTLRVTGSYAPAIDNLIGDQHDSGLVTVGVGAIGRR